MIEHKAILVDSHNTVRYYQPNHDYQFTPKAVEAALDKWVNEGWRLVSITEVAGNTNWKIDNLSKHGYLLLFRRRKLVWKYHPVRNSYATLQFLCNRLRHRVGAWLVRAGSRLSPRHEQEQDTTA